MESNALLEDLIQSCADNAKEVKRFKNIPLSILNQRPEPNSWSALECIEHLNYYGSFYLPEIDFRIKNSRYQIYNTEFTSTWLGNYFAKLMRPKEQLNKLKTFKSMDPMGSNLSPEVIDTFLYQQKQLCQLLERARKVDLNKTKTAISISKLIKLRLGDTFRVVIYHNQRHVLQALRALEYGKKAAVKAKEEVAH